MHLHLQLRMIPLSCCDRYAEDGKSPRKIYWDLQPEHQMLKLYANAVVAALLPLKEHQSSRASYQVEDIQDSPVSVIKDL